MLDLLNDFAARLATDEQALGLLALGSSGLDQHRLDAHSDLDFFVIAREKAKFLDDLWWLGPVAWSHRDTPDGCKALVAGVFCEFAVFTPVELPAVRFVWQRDDLEWPPPNVPARPDTQWLVNEILSNLYVGLHRWRRGEKLSAMRFIQGEALDNFLRLVGEDDPFTPSRRAERLDLPLAQLADGYEGTLESARTLFSLLPPGGGAMRTEVARLLGE